MNELKTIGRVSASGIFKVSIILFAVLLPVVLIFGTSSHIKNTLRDSGIYSTAVDQALDSATKNADKSNSLPFDQPEVRTAVKQAIPPEQLQAWAEQMIDGTYGWLNSNAADPVIHLDFASVKQNLANSLGDYAVTRAKGLPVCTNAQLQALQASGGDIDPLTAICVPRGFDVQSLRATVHDEVLNNTDILDKNSFTAADFPKNDQGKTVFEQADLGRTGYHWAMIAPYILATVALLTAVLWMLMHDNRRRGAYVVSRSLFGVGVFIAISAIVVRYLITQVSSPTGPIAKNVQGDIQSTVVYLIKNLGNSIDNVYLTVGLVYVAVGGVALLILHFTKPRASEPVADEPADNDIEAVAAPASHGEEESTKSIATSDNTDEAQIDKATDKTKQ